MNLMPQNLMGINLIANSLKHCYLASQSNLSMNQILSHLLLAASFSFRFSFLFSFLFCRYVSHDRRFLNSHIEIRTRIQKMFNDQYDNNNVVMYLLPRRHQNTATKLEADRRNAKKNQSKQAITMTPEVKSCSMFLAIKNKENRNEKHKTISSCICIVNATWYLLYLELLTCSDKHNLLVPFYCESRINESPVL